MDSDFQIGSAGVKQFSLADDSDNSLRKKQNPESAKKSTFSIGGMFSTKKSPEKTKIQTSPEKDMNSSGMFAAKKMAKDIV